MKELQIKKAFMSGYCGTTWIANKKYWTSYLSAAYDRPCV